MEQENEAREPTGKEVYEAKRSEKDAVKKSSTQSARTSAQTKKYVRIVVWLVVAAAALVAGGWWLSTLGPKGEDRSEFVPEMGREHIADDAPPVEYNSNPPTSGPHFAVPARGGFRAEQIADGHIIHSLEHGFVWISYRPDVPAEVVEQLERLAGSLVIVAERPENDTDIALAAWTRLDTWDLPEDGTLDTQRVEDFIARYRNRGPERLPAGQHGGI